MRLVVEAEYVHLAGLKRREVEVKLQTITDSFQKLPKGPMALIEFSFIKI